MLRLAIALAALSGLVTGPDGRPVAGAKAGASPFERNLDTVFATTNPQGEYSFDLPGGDWVVYVDAAGYEMAIEAARAGRLDFKLETVTPSGPLGNLSRFGPHHRKPPTRRAVPPDREVL